MTTVHNMRNERFEQTNNNHVRIDRASRWGNPYRIGHDGNTRAKVIDMYRDRLWRQIKEGVITLDDLTQLQGMKLFCWCAPQGCHGDVVKAAIEWAVEEQERIELEVE